MNKLCAGFVQVVIKKMDHKLTGVALAIVDGFSQPHHPHFRPLNPLPSRASFSGRTAVFQADVPLKAKAVICRNVDRKGWE